MSGDLPRGWAEIEIGDLTAPMRPRCDPQEYPRLPFVGMEQVESYSGRLIGTVSSATMKSTAFQFQPGDVLYGRLRPYLNKVLCAEFKGLCSSEFIVLPPMGSFDPKYLAFYLRTDGFVSFSNQLNQGDRPRVSFDQISSYEVPLAPLAEQKRIVAKVEKLLSKVDASRARLEKVSALIKRFRQSVLAAACSGRLTADWRGENPRVESGANLLVRIKQARLVAAVNAKETRQIDAAFHGAKLSVEASELGIEQFPDSWVACQIGTIGSVVNGSTPSRMHDEYWNGKIPWVSSGEVRNNIISETRERITQSGYDNCSVNLLPCGSVLLAMIGEGKTRGQSAILQVAATINQNIAAVLIPHGLVLSEFLWRWFLFQYDATREQGSGSGPQALNCQRVRELPFVLPPLAEQKEIVRRVEELFALADRLEARVGKARGQVDKLTQSILAKAFRGELVPQDPNDEPAEKLLARIRTTTGPVAVQGGKVASSVSVRRGRPRKVR